MFRKSAAVGNAFRKANPNTGQPRALAGLRAQVRFYPDYSGSMEWPGRKYYTGGVMQLMAERFLGLGLQLDPDGVIEVTPFSNELHDTVRVGLQANPAKKIDTYQDVVNRRIWKGEHTLGGTLYAPVLRDILHVAQTQKKDDLIVAAIPTDGDPQDGDEAFDLVLELSQYAVLLKFMAVNHVEYLQQLDDLEDKRPGARLFDNVDTKFFDGQEWPTIHNIDDVRFAEAMADEIDSGIAGAMEAGVLLAA